MADGDGITFNIVKNLGVISEGKGGWKKELNMVSWSGRDPKIDVRDWSPGHVKMSKGITLTGEEAKSLFKLLSQHLEVQDGGGAVEAKI
ncbi:MAG: hypothetical protein LBC53_10690 [Spirochaetaceae bacterium]|jgi:hypothetical protein|nr:hypothetical protein [Spirochaetaceae bacterium]